MEGDTTWLSEMTEELQKLGQISQEGDSYRRGRDRCKKMRGLFISLKVPELTLPQRPVAGKVDDTDLYSSLV